MKAVVALNRIAQKLGHLCALDSVEVDGIKSVAALEAAWLAKGAAANQKYASEGRPEFMGIAGWGWGTISGEDMWFDVDEPRNRPAVGVSHRSGTGRIEVRAIDQWASCGTRWASDPRIAIELYAGPHGDAGPRRIAALVAEQDSHGLNWEVVYDGLTSEDLGARADRLEFLVWVIEALIDGARINDWADILPRVRAAWDRLVSEHAEAVCE